MKYAFFYSILLIFLLGFIGNLFLPWWSVAALAMIGGVWFEQKSGWSFLAGFIAIAMLWGGYAFWQNLANDGILANKMGELFNLNGSLLLMVSAIIGGLLGGLGALTGNLARIWLKP